MDNSLSLLEAFKLGWPVLLLYLRWLQSKQDKLEDRLDDAMQQTIKRDEYNGTIEQLRREIRDGNQAITGRLDLFLALNKDRNAS